MAHKNKRPRKEDKAEVNETIFVGNIPTNVEFASLLKGTATHVSELLSRHQGGDTTTATSKLEGSGANAVAELSVDGDIVASFRLVHQTKGNVLKCRGFGFLNLTSDEWAPEDLVTAFRSLSTPLETTLLDGTVQTADLIFRYDNKGKDHEKALGEHGQGKKDDSLRAAGQRLLELVKQKSGGTMHINDWPSKDRRGINLMGKRRKISPSAAAEAAGLDWNGQASLFSIKGATAAKEEDTKGNMGSSDGSSSDGS